MQGFVGQAEKLSLHFKTLLLYSPTTHGPQLLSSGWDMFASDCGVRQGLRAVSRAVCVLGHQLCELSISLSSGNPLADYLWAQVWHYSAAVP